MNGLWGGMILIGVIYGAFAGTLPEVTEAVVQSAGEAVELCLSLAGITALWTGIMKIGEHSGLVERLAKRLGPVLNFLFPSIRKEEKAKHYISLNFLSNILGLGWASTSFGLMAFRELDRIHRRECAGQQGQESKASGGRGRGKRRPSPERASTAMCTFLIINVSSLQLIPVNIIACRAQYGSAVPAAIVGPAILTTAVSTGAAVVFCKLMGGRS
ncbi:MAG: nucleoside recognition protein [Eubacteriales bacterium]|nr:nucleoside recognition protein [Eubacteriales bacterium]